MEKYRFYIKDNQIAFILKPDEYLTSEDCNHSATLCNNGYDSYIDKVSEHPMWDLQDGELVELTPDVVYDANPDYYPNQE